MDVFVHAGVLNTATTQQLFLSLVLLLTCLVLRLWSHLRRYTFQ